MFVIDPKIEADSMHIATLGQTQVRLMKDGRYFWVLLVPEVDGAEELHDLDAAMRDRLSAMTAHFSMAIKRATNCEKINSAAIGNIVRMLHVHVIARSPDDAAWPGPVWGHGQASALTPADEDWRSAVLKEACNIFAA